MNEMRGNWLEKFNFPLVSPLRTQTSSWAQSGWGAARDADVKGLRVCFAFWVRVALRAMCVACVLSWIDSQCWPKRICVFVWRIGHLTRGEVCLMEYDEWYWVRCLSYIYIYAALVMVFHAIFQRVLRVGANWIYVGLVKKKEWTCRTNIIRYRF